MRGRGREGDFPLCIECVARAAVVNGTVNRQGSRVFNVNVPLCSRPPPLLLAHTTIAGCYDPVLSNDAALFP